MKTGYSDFLINWFLTSSDAYGFYGRPPCFCPFLFCLKLKTEGSGGSSVTSTVRRELVVTLLSLAVTVVSSFNLEKLPFSVHP